MGLAGRYAAKRFSDVQLALGSCADRTVLMHTVRGTALRLKANDGCGTATLQQPRHCRHHRQHDHQEREQDELRAGHFPLWFARALTHDR